MPTSDTFLLILAYFWCDSKTGGISQPKTWPLPLPEHNNPPPVTPLLCVCSSRMTASSPTVAKTKEWAQVTSSTEIRSSTCNTWRLNSGCPTRPSRPRREASGVLRRRRCVTLLWSLQWIMLIITVLSKHPGLGRRYRGGYFGGLGLCRTLAGSRGRALWSMVWVTRRPETENFSL